MCSEYEWESLAPTYTTDRQCTAYTQCNLVVSSPDGEWESVPPIYAADRNCTTLTRCAATEWESAAPVKTADRGCTPITICRPYEYISTAATRTSDLNCTAVTNCTEATGTTFAGAGEYESVAPWPGRTNRECGNVISCAGTLRKPREWETSAPSFSSNRRCAPLTVCGGEDYEQVPPTELTDRLCAAPNAPEAGGVVVNVTLRLSFATAAAAPEYHRRQLITDLSTLLQISASRIMLTRMLPGSTVMEFIIQPLDGELKAMDVVLRLEKLHENQASKLYSSNIYPVLGRIDPNIPLEYLDVRDGISFFTTMCVAAAGALLLCCGVTLEARHPRRRFGSQYKVAPEPGGGEKEEEVVGGGGGGIMQDPSDPGKHCDGPLWMRSRLLVSLAAGVLDYLFLFTCLQADAEFAASGAGALKYQFASDGSMITLWGAMPLASIVAGVLLGHQKKKIRQRARMDREAKAGPKAKAVADDELPPQPAGRVLLFHFLSAACPELLCALPWPESQRQSLQVATACMAVVQSVPQIIFQLEYSTREGGFDIGTGPGLVAALALAVNMASLLSRVGARYGSIWMARSAAKLAKLKARVAEMMPEEKGTPLWKIQQEVYEQKKAGKIEAAAAEAIAAAARNARKPWQRKVELAPMAGVLEDVTLIGGEPTKVRGPRLQLLCPPAN